MRFVSQFARFQNWDENRIATQEVVGSRLNGGGSVGGAGDPFSPSAPSGGTADISSDGTGAVPF